MKPSERSDAEFEAWKSKEIFSEDTQNRIRNSLSLARKEVDSLNLEISLLRSTKQTPPNKLLADLAKKTEEIEVLQGAISPLKKIPHEILCEFFLYSDDTMSLLKIPHRRMRAFPWALAQVCSHWRDILWGIPGVWENIRIWDDVQDAEIPAVVDIFQTILARSGVQISLTAPHNDQLFTKLVLPNLNRLKGLEMVVDRDSFRTLFELPGGSVDSLISINFHFGSGALPYLKSNSFKTSPNLRKVTLTNNLGVRDWPNRLWCLPWAQLTDIALPTSLIHTTFLHGILGECICLRTATLVIGMGGSDYFDRGVIVPKLESLVLYRTDLALNWEAFLRPLILPSLRSILVPDAQTWNQAEFTSLVVRSACPLKSIHLAYYRGTTHDLYSFLERVPSLCKLILPWLHIPDSVFKAIHQRKILPILGHLECIVDPSGLNAVLDLIESYISENSSAENPHVGINLGRLVFSSDEEDFDNPLKDPLKRYYRLDPIFRENGRDINVITSL
ncbi:hypothetical protein BDZ94DRAFT_1266426 [Collybia nuda]|uniref:BHLH domain-containing protein n=1 Tax=Collybia nuda TaxID=64659 RepID=A0A9P6CGS7_9AGAR|nr:hypothetical protein BDZ94DRAFT_1266426 [Collybia nuda]